MKYKNREDQITTNAPISAKKSNKNILAIIKHPRMNELELACSLTPCRQLFRETGVSRHHGGSLKSIEHHSIIITRGLREALNWAPIQPIG